MVKFDKLEVLAKFMMKLNKKKFYFGEVITKVYERNNKTCGAICCAIGWTPTIWPKEVRWVGSSVELIGNEEIYAYEEVAKRLFNMSSDEAIILFSPTNYMSRAKTIKLPWEKYLPSNLTSKSLNNKASPRTVAASIRAYIKWKKAKLK